MKRTILISLLIFLPQIALAGSQTFTSSGTFTVPTYDTLTVTVDGGGGGGGSGTPRGMGATAGGAGSSSSFNGTVIGNGGGGGALGTPVTAGCSGCTAPAPAGSAGGGSGGTVTTGGGGTGGTGGCYMSVYYCGGPGGSGGKVVATYASGDLSSGSPISVVVGNAGTGGRGFNTGVIYADPGSPGQGGSVTVTWTDPPPAALQCSGTQEIFSAPGTYTRTVPTYSSMSVTVNGAGGGGGSGAYFHSTGYAGSAGTGSSFNGTVLGNGGGGGGAGTLSGPGAPGSSGSATGGDTNNSGGGATGGTGSAPYPGYGGGNGGAGGQAAKTYTSGMLTTGSSVIIVVGGGGPGGAAAADPHGTPGSTGSNGSVTITCSQNSPPTTPVITGPTSGFTKTNYTYTFRSTDPDSDTIRYAVDWDNNGSIDEYVPALGYVSSGTTGSTSHSWNSSNTQTFKALAQDSKGATSGWASYTVNMSPNPPTVLLTASSYSITNGQSSTLTWSSTNANSCTGTNFSTGGATQNTSPGVSVSPTVTTTYTVTCTGAGGTASDSKTVTYTCTATNICSGQNVVNSCTGAIVQSCSYQCGAGACIPPPPPVFNPDPVADTTGHLQVRPSLVVMGDRTHVFWNVSNVTSCTASRDNPPPESWTVAGTSGNGWTSSSGSGGIQSGSIVERTTFRLVCTPFAGQTFEPETAVVNVVPVFEEQ